MAEQFAVSPLLDGFTIGTPVNDHYGVCCYPAVKENSQRKYIVKVISIPPSQTQLDALLITGAYKNSSEAVDYFRQLSDDLLEEAQLLHDLSRLEGFVAFEGCQVEPMGKNRIGYQLYLLSGFRLSLERYMHRHTVSHLEAVNLGIDLCAALSACRKAGRMYIDLKPSNIFISTKKEYKIGDLGFVPLDSMKYSSMPEKYRSCYTPPELLDDLSVLNGTADTYALGMILYQIFNNGALPQELTKPLPAPASADEEMTAILLKACAPDPADRWQDPGQMGQALIDYMQRGTINDVPIMEPIPGSLSGRKDEALYQTTQFPIPQEQQAEEAPEQPPVPEQEELEQEKPEEAEAAVSFAETLSAAGEIPLAEETVEEAAETTAEPVSPEEEAPLPEKWEVVEEAPTEDSFDLEAPAEAEALSPSGEADIPELSTMDIEAAAAEEFSKLTGDYLPPEEETPAIDPEQLDQELAQMNQFLRASEKPVVRERKPQPHVEPVVIKPPKKKRSPVGVLFFILFLCFLLAAGVWGYMYYETEYLQTVNDVTITEDLSKVTVQVDSGIQEGLLSVVFTDPYGNSFSRSVRGGIAEFTDLTPGTFYNVQVQISGLHKLQGPVSLVHTTEGITNVAALNAGMGTENGSVLLSMVVEGHEPEQWKVYYSAEGEPELAQAFTGHSVTISNLTIGKLYTFRMELINGGNQSVAGGQSTVQFTPSQVINAENLSIVSCADGALTVQWSSSTDILPEYWQVRCAGADYDESQQVTSTQAVFNGISSDKSYTVEVCAKGMTQVSRVTVSANPITLVDFRIDESNPQELVLSWQYQGAAPENGCMVMYTLDNSDLPSVVKAQGTTATIAPRIPGAVYHFTIQADGDVSVFGGSQVYICPAAEIYSGHAVKGSNISARLLATPEDKDWSYYSLSSDSYTQSFAAGQPISVLLQSNIRFYLENEDIQILYVFRDASGGAAPELVGEDTKDWKEMWMRDDQTTAELNVPVSPTKAGNYVLDIYFNGLAVTSANLTVY